MLILILSSIRHRIFDHAARLSWRTSHPMVGGLRHRFYREADGTRSRVGGKLRNYYSAKLCGERLRQCYALASPRVAEYLEAEIQFLLGQLRRSDSVLELGCGYGRVCARLADSAKRVVGIDNANESIELARRLHGPRSRCEFEVMDAAALTFDESEFHKVVCVQNGICAFGIDRGELLQQALRVAKPGGRVVFSTYSERFWTHRLKWFEAQSAAGLVGEIDYSQTGNGTIVCKDGFRAGLVLPAEFQSLCSNFCLASEIIEVNESCVFCEIVVPAAA